MEKKLTPEETVKMLVDMQESKLNVPEVLEKLAQIRRSIPGIEDAPRSHDHYDGRSRLPDGFAAEAEDFEEAAVIDALHSLIEDIDAMLDRRAFEREFGKLLPPEE